MRLLFLLLNKEFSSFWVFKNSTPLSTVIDLKTLLNNFPYLFSKEFRHLITLDEVLLGILKIISWRANLSVKHNKVVLIPNGSLIGGNVINYSTKPTRRVDLTFDIDYAEDFKKSVALILDICSKHELILKDPAPTCRIAAWKESSIQLSCKVWVNNADYWTVTFDLLETVYDEMNKAGIKIPYNQIEVSYRNALIQKEKETGDQ